MNPSSLLLVGYSIPRRRSKLRSLRDVYLAGLNCLNAGYTDAHLEDIYLGMTADDMKRTAQQMRRFFIIFGAGSDALDTS
jgi:hypothetical protein